MGTKQTTQKESKDIVDVQVHMSGTMQQITSSNFTHVNAITAAEQNSIKINNDGQNETNTK